MKKLELYTGTKTYMFPNGHLAAPPTMLEQFPAILTFTHVIETDELGEVCFAVENLSALKSIYGVSSALNVADSIAELQIAINVIPENEPTAEERIAASLEFQNMMML